MRNKVVAFIPVRGGSKSIPLKNIKEFCGKPLVYWNCKALQDCKLVDEIIIATDSEQIKNTVLSFGFSKLKVYDRESKNAEDTSSTESVMLEYINKSMLNKDDIFMLVQATSPLTQTSDFTEALNKYAAGNFDSLLSCVRIKRFFWNEDGTAKNYDYKNRPRRQNFVGDLMENGAFYINRISSIASSQNRLSGKIAIYEMPEWTAVEIDEEEDWLVAEKIFKKRVKIKE